MNFDQLCELRGSAVKNRSKGLPLLDRLAELRSNEVDQVGFARYKAVIGVDATPDGSRIVS